MRNCFVPGCDSYCKANNCVQRKMFSAPKAMIYKWKEALPKNKREFKENDRVCERHFEPDDITEYWENNINGVIHRTKRDKPKLNSSAVPSKNLDVDHLNITPAKKALKKTVPKRPLAIDDNDNAPMQEEFVSVKRVKNEDAAVEARVRSVQEQTSSFGGVQIGCSPIKESNEPIDDDKLEAFEMLYDEIHDVTLPSMLWGHHRCSERRFIVFSAFCDEKMNFNKFLYINERLTCKVFVNGKSKTLDLEKDQCNPEHVSNWLEKIDEEE